MKIKIFININVWEGIARFAYRRYAKASSVKPVGIPGNRDPEHECIRYSPRKKLFGDWDDCESDGHYLCRKCCHLQVKEMDDK